MNSSKEPDLDTTVLIAESTESTQTGNNITSEEDRIFGSRHPFVTLISLALGPLLYHLAATSQDAIDLFIVKKGYGDEGASPVAIASMVRYIIITFSGFLSDALTIQISGLIAKKEINEASQLLSDALRLSFFIGIAFPIIIYFSVNPLLRFIDCPKESLDTCAKYSISASLLSFFISVFQFLCASLLGIGRSTLAGMFQLSALIISLGIADPIFCFALKTPIWALGLSYSAGQVFCGFILLVLFFSGKFTLKPKLRMFFRKPSQSFYSALGKSAQYAIGQLAGFFPPVFMLKFVISAAKVAGIPETSASQLFSTFTKPYNIIGTVAVGFMAGFPPAASYAFNSRQYKRVMSLWMYALIIPLATTITLVTIFVSFPKAILGIWIDSEETLSYAPYVRNALYTLCLKPITESLKGLLILTGHSFLGALPPFVVFVSEITACFTFHYTQNSKPWLNFYCFMIADLVDIVTALSGSTVPFLFLKRSIHADKISTASSHLL